MKYGCGGGKSETPWERKEQKKQPRIIADRGRNARGIFSFGRLRFRNSAYCANQAAHRRRGGMCVSHMWIGWNADEVNRAGLNDSDLNDNGRTYARVACRDFRVPHKCSG